MVRVPQGFSTDDIPPVGSAVSSEIEGDGDLEGTKEYWQGRLYVNLSSGVSLVNRIAVR